MSPMDLDEIVRAYVGCALWSSIDDDGDPLDDGRDEDDIAPECLAMMRADCEAFLALVADTIPAYIAAGGSAEQFGHDFWLTRNGHGAGFWDRGLGALGDRLSTACKPFGTMDLYIGDDGKVWAS